jgi:hypothetical protein
MAAVASEDVAQQARIAAHVAHDEQECARRSGADPLRRIGRRIASSSGSPARYLARTSVGQSSLRICATTRKPFLAARFDHGGLAFGEVGTADDRAVRIAVADDREIDAAGRPASRTAS